MLLVFASAIFWFSPIAVVRPWQNWLSRRQVSVEKARSDAQLIEAMERGYPGCWVDLDSQPALRENRFEQGLNALGTGFGFENVLSRNSPMGESEHGQTLLHRYWPAGPSRDEFEQFLVRRHHCVREIEERLRLDACRLRDLLGICTTLAESHGEVGGNWRCEIADAPRVERELAACDMGQTERGMAMYMAYESRYQGYSSIRQVMVSHGLTDNGARPVHWISYWAVLFSFVMGAGLAPVLGRFRQNGGPGLIALFLASVGALLVFWAFPALGSSARTDHFASDGDYNLALRLFAYLYGAAVCAASLGVGRSRRWWVLCAMGVVAVGTPWVPLIIYLNLHRSEMEISHQILVQLFFLPPFVCALLSPLLIRLVQRYERLPAAD